MLRSLRIDWLTFLLAGIVLGMPLRGAIWPEEFFGFKRISLEKHSPGAEPVWEEYGFEEGEKAVYEKEGQRFTGVAERYADSTGAMAAFQWKRPAGARPSTLSELAVEWPTGAYLAFGNYLLRFDGYKPTAEQLVGFYLVLPRLEKAALPTFVGFLPSEGKIAGSERYILGPASLAAFEPQIPPAVAAFHYGTEAQLARYQSQHGPLELVLFSYPTPQIARERLEAFRSLPGAVVKRSGPLVAVVMNPPDLNEAEKLLSRVQYRVSITWDEPLSKERDLTLLDIILTALALIGILVGFALVAGLLFAGYHALARKAAGPGGEDPMIMLHLDEHR